MSEKESTEKFGYLKITILIISGFVLFILLGFALIYNSKQELYKSALSSMEKKNWQDAVETWNILGNFKDSTSQNFIASTKAAEKSIKDKQYSKAVDYYNIAKSLKPDSADVKNSLEKATKLKEKAVKHEIALYIQKGNTSLSKNKWEQAIKEYNLAISFDKSLKNKLSNKLNKAQKLLNKQRNIQELAIVRKKQARERTKIAEKMNYFEGDNVQIAVTKVKMTSSTDDHVSTGNSRFVWVHVSTYNTTYGTTPVNPNYFTLSDSDGYTVSHDSDTYSLSNYFDAVDLPSNGKTSGWLIFYLPKDYKYTLHYYDGFGNSVDKEIIVNS